MMIGALRSGAAAAISRAVGFLHGAQRPYGEFAIFASSSNDLRDCVFDSSPFVTAIALDSMRLVADRRIPAMRRKGLTFLVEEMEVPGVWRYWTSRSTLSIDPDLDDTCLISALLRDYVPNLGIDSNLDRIINNRNSDGLYYTWLRNPGENNDIDSVVNANVLSYLGQRHETEAVVGYLNDLIVMNRESGSYRYYVGDWALYYALSRAYRVGVSTLDQCRANLIAKMIARQDSNGSFDGDLNTAYALCALASLGCEDEVPMCRAVENLIERQMADGGWPRVAAYTGPPAPKLMWWGSEELTTAISLEALARWHRNPSRAASQ
jgi:hypothetical protein